jgi:hypothetical protein
VAPASKAPGTVPARRPFLLLTHVGSGPKLASLGPFRPHGYGNRGSEKPGGTLLKGGVPSKLLFRPGKAREGANGLLFINCLFILGRRRPCFRDAAPIPFPSRAARVGTRRHASRHM